MGNGYRSFCDYCDNGCSECEPQWQSAVDRIRTEKKEIKVAGPVRKDFCESLLNEEFKKIYNELEEKLNKSLLLGGRRYDVEHISSKWREKIVAFTIEKYKAAGWTVKRVSGSDCRNDTWDYLAFS